MIVVLTGGEQSGNDDLSEAVKREITQGLQEGHGLDNGVAIAGACIFFDFETCEGISLFSQGVRYMAC